MQVSSPFNAVSIQEQAISHLFVVVLIISAVILAVVTGLVTYILFVYGRKQKGEPRQVFGNTPMEIVWTAVPLILIVVIFVLTVQTMGISDPPAGHEPPEMIVIGHQWWWEVQYPGVGILTANEVHLPVGRRLLVQFDSADVIHDFWVPQMGRKIDIIPGHPNHLWLEVDQPGIFLGACAEYCGAEHAWMRIRVIGEPEVEFQAWERSQLRVPPAPAEAAAVQGATLFRNLTCINCHAIAGTAATARIAPDLTHLASRQTLAAGRLDNTPVNLAAWLLQPDVLKPASHMPNLQLTEAQVRDLVAYLETLR